MAEYPQLNIPPPDVAALVTELNRTRRILDAARRWPAPLPGSTRDINLHRLITREVTLTEVMNILHGTVGYRYGSEGVRDDPPRDQGEQLTFDYTTMRAELPEPGRYSPLDGRVRGK